MQAKMFLLGDKHYWNEGMLFWIDHHAGAKRLRTAIVCNNLNGIVMKQRGWVLEKLKAASDESYLDPTNLQVIN